MGRELQDFPRIARYGLSTHSGRPLARTFAPGPTHVRYWREYRSAGSFSKGCYRWDGKRADTIARSSYRLDCLREFLEPYLWVGPKVETELAHRWVNEASYRTAIETDLRLLHTEWRTLLGWLRRKNVEITDPQLALLPVTLEVHDERSDWTVPLPGVETGGR
jgi:hypothetical protein